MSGVSSSGSCAIVEFAYPVSDLAGLRAVSAFDRIDKQARLVEDKGAIYYFNALGTGADDNENIIKPNDILPSDPGRWFKIQDGAVLDHQSLLNLQGGSVAERYHLLLAQYSGLIGGGSTTLHKHSHTNLDNIGTKTHPQIDSHIGSISNPHSVTKAQVGLGAVTNDAQLKRAAGDFSSFDPKTTLVSADLVLIEDSADSWKKKKVTFESLSYWKSSNVVDRFGHPFTVIQPRNETASVFVGPPFSIDWEDLTWQPDGVSAHVVHTGSDIWAKRALIGVNTFDPSGRPEARAWGSQVYVIVPKTNANVWGDPGFSDPTMIGGEWTVKYQGKSDLLYPGYIVGGYVVAHVWCAPDDAHDVTVDEIQGFHIQQPGVDLGWPYPVSPRRWLVNSKGLVIEDRAGDVAGHTANRWGLFVTTTAINYLRNSLGIGVQVPLSKIHIQLADNFAGVTNPILALFDCAPGKSFNASSGKQTAASINPSFAGQTGTAEATILDLRSTAPPLQCGTRIGIDLSNGQLEIGTPGNNFFSKFNSSNYWRADGLLMASSIEVGGSLKTKNRYEKVIVTDSTPYAVATTDENVICDKATAMTVNLPVATGNGRILTIKNIGVGVVTVNANGAETIDGTTPRTLNQWEAITILDNDTGTWVIL